MCFCICNNLHTNIQRRDKECVFFMHTSKPISWTEGFWDTCHLLGYSNVCVCGFVRQFVSVYVLVYMCA